MKLLNTAKTYICAWKNKGTLKPEDEMDVNGKVVVITGSNSGIGKATAFEMAKRRAVVVMACRDMEKAEKVAEEIRTKYPEANLDLVHLDLGDLASVRECAERIRTKHSTISILINNAGILYTDGVIRNTTDGFEVHMGINHLGPFLFTMLLLDLLQKATPSRIVFTSSTLYMLAELNLSDLMLQERGSFGFKHWGPYNNSKLAIMYFAMELGKKLEGTGINTYAICPGYVKTDAFRNETGFGAWLSQLGLLFTGLRPEQGCETILYCSLSRNLAQESGEMYHFNHRWDNAMSDLEAIGIGPQLWAMSKDLVGLEHNL